MVKIAEQQKRIVRETSSLDRSRPLVVELHPGYVAIWPKGTKESLRVSWGAILDLGRKLEARRLV